MSALLDNWSWWMLAGQVSVSAGGLAVVTAALRREQRQAAHRLVQLRTRHERAAEAAAVRLAGTAIRWRAWLEADTAAVGGPDAKRPRMGVDAPPSTHVRERFDATALS